MAEIKIHCLYDELKDPSELREHNKQTNTHTKDQVNRLAQIITYQGWRYPVKVSKQTGMITCGHARVQAAKIINCKVPVNYQNYETPEMEIADVTSDNAIAAWADIDLTLVNNFALDLGESFNLDLLGIKDFSLDLGDKYDEATEDDIPEVKAPISVLGDLYEIGSHRVLCGDSTDILQVEMLMSGQKADMVFTDPPYGMHLDADYSKMGSDTIKPGKNHDNIIGDNFDFDPGIIFGIFDYCKEIILFGADYYAEKLVNKNEGSWLVWDKRVEDRYDKIIGSAFELIWSKRKMKRQIIRHEYVSWANRMADNVDGKKPHPTMKPVALLNKILDKIEGKLVVDLFGGSGSTLIACEKTNRKCFMMELDPHYIDVIISRWVKYTGITKVTRNGLEVDWKELANGQDGQTTN